MKNKGYEPILKFALRSTESDQSDAIILTFHSKWHDPLMQQKVSVVFRKTGLRAFQPACLYAYLSAPTSAIVAKMSVTSYEYLDVEEAIQLAGKGQISIEELRAYATNYSKLLVYRIGKVYMAKHPATFQKLSSEYDFWPSSTFIPLSKTGATTLDRICSFYDVTQR